MRLAVLGGSYNPIHNGHLAFADAVCRRFGYDAIALVPAFLSPFKKEHTGSTAADRVAMVEAAIADNPLFYCEKCEIQREGTSYTIDTLKFLTEKYPDIEGKIGLIIGEDLLDGFYRWHKAEYILNYAELIVGSRGLNELDSIKTAELDTGLHRPSYKTIENAVLPISSTQIRQAIKEKKSWRYLVPPAVYAYITENKLYE